GLTGIRTPTWSHQSRPGPTASTMPCWGGGSSEPAGTSSPERRIRSGSSSLMTTRSNNGRSWLRITPFDDRSVARRRSAVLVSFGPDAPDDRPLLDRLLGTPGDPPGGGHPIAHVQGRRDVHGVVRSRQPERQAAELDDAPHGDRGGR